MAAWFASIPIIVYEGDSAIYQPVGVVRMINAESNGTWKEIRLLSLTGKGNQWNRRATTTTNLNITTRPTKDPEIAKSTVHEW